MSAATEPGARGRLAELASGPLGALLVVLVALIAYANVLPNELVLDDRELLGAHPALRGFDLAELLGGRYWGPLRGEDTLWRPTTMLVLALEGRLGASLGLAWDSPWVWRAGSVLWHALASALVWRLFRAFGLGASAALFGGLVFAVHPLHTEVVCSATNGSESFAVIFGALFLLAQRAGRPLLGALALLAALGSKESAVAWLFVALWAELALDWRAPTRAKRVLGWALALVALGVWTAARARAIAGVELVVPYLSNPLQELGFLERLPTALAAQLRYVSLLTWPAQLSSDYSYDAFLLARSLFDPRAFGFFALCVAAFVLAARAWSRDRRPAFLLGAWALFAAPTANVLLPIGTILGERLAYGSSIAFAGFVGLGWAALARRAPRLAWILGLALLAAATVRTQLRNATWRDSERFYTEQLATAAGSAAAHYGYAWGVAEPAGRREDALAHYRRALEIWPGYLNAWNNVGILQAEGGELEAARRTFAGLVEREPRYTRGQYGLGRVLFLQGDLPGAIDAFAQALALDPGHHAARVELARALLGRGAPGDRERARAELARVLAQAPSYGPAHALAAALEAGS